MTPRSRRQSRRRADGSGSVEAMPKRGGTDQPTSAPLAVSQPELTAGADPYPTGLPELMTTAEVAAALRITPYQVREYVARAVLPAYRVGRELRVPRDAVARYLHSLRVTR